MRAKQNSSAYNIQTTESIQFQQWQKNLNHFHLPNIIYNTLDR